MDSALRFRTFFFRQRLNSVGIPFLFGVLLQLLLPGIIPAILLLFLASLLLLLSFFKRDREERISLLFAIAGISFSLILLGAEGFRQEQNESLHGKTALAEGYVVSVSEESFDLCLLNFPFQKVRVTSDALPETGRRIRLPLSFSSAVSDADRADGADLLAESEGEWEVTGKSLWFTALGSLRTRLIEGFGNGREGGFFRAILLGDRSELTKEDESAFEATSSAHLLSISGLHVTQILGMVSFFVRYLPVGRRGKSLILLPSVVLLLFLTGASVSVFRAALMASFPLVGTFFLRRSDSVTSLVFAASVLTLLEPFSLLSPSFLLSFSATFGILVAGGPLCELLYQRLFLEAKGKKNILLYRALFFVLSSFAVAESVFVITFPVQLLLFDEIYVLSPLFALILIPLFSPCVFFGVLQAVCLSLSLSFPSLAALAERTGAYYLRFISFLAKGSPAPLSLGGAALPMALAVLGILLYLMARRKPIESLFWVHLTICFICLLFPLVSGNLS